MEQNLIHHIGNRPAYAVLAETFQKLPPDEQRKAQGNLFIGLVVNEYLEDFHRGDFLVRNLIGGDPHSGVLAVGALPRAGQTMQFQRRDAAAATEDMNELLARAKKQLGGATIYGGCLCCCNGRGKNLFGRAEPRRRTGAGAARPARPRRIFLQRRNRPGRRKEFSARLHRLARAVCEKVIDNSPLLLPGGASCSRGNAGRTTSGIESTRAAAKSGRRTAAGPSRRTRTRPRRADRAIPRKRAGPPPTRLPKTTARAKDRNTARLERFFRHQPGG